MVWHSPPPKKLISSEKMARFSTAFVTMAALCWGLSGGIGALLLDKGWDAFVLVFYRGAIGLLFVSAWLALRPRNSGLANPRLWFWSTIAALGVAGNFSFYFVSIAECSVAVAATLMYCAPVFVYLASIVFKIESITSPKLVAIVMVIVGIVLLTGIFHTGAVGVTPIGVGAGLLAGLSYALFIFGFKYATPHGSPQAILMISFAGLCTILIWLADTDQIFAVLNTPDWPLFVILGVLGAGLSFILYIAGLKNTAPTVASIVAMVEPVTAFLFGIMVLNEKLLDSQIFGMALILVTVTALSVYSRRQAT